MLPTWRFRPTLTHKIIISLTINGICMITALIYAINSLGTMQNIADDIAHNEIRAATLMLTLKDNFLAQQRAVGKYLILHQDDFKDIYGREHKMFIDYIAMLNGLHMKHLTGQIADKYYAYSIMAEQVFNGEIIPEEIIRQTSKSVESEIDKLRTLQLILLNQKTASVDQQKTRATTIALVLAFGGVSLSVVVSVLLVISFSTSIAKLQQATHRIADGDFEHDPQIPNGDEVGALAADFMRMAVRLKDLELMNLDASPLTRLPGNIAIERVINRHINEQSAFVMCYLDLDNFKSYNDRYGYIKASDLLKEAGKVIYEAVSRLDDQDAFIGHIGGDDFVVVTNIEIAERACQAIIKSVDALIPAYYSDEDLLVGAINGVDRYGVPRMFPLVSISIAALICEPGDFTSAADIATEAAIIKDSVKVAAGSNYRLIRGRHCCESA